MRSCWNKLQIEDFIEWHENVIQQYPISIQKELRSARESWMPKMEKKHE
jgi:hypothetical protein